MHLARFEERASALFVEVGTFSRFCKSRSLEENTSPVINVTYNLSVSALLVSIANTSFYEGRTCSGGWSGVQDNEEVYTVVDCFTFCPSINHGHAHMGATQKTIKYVTIMLPYLFTIEQNN